MGTITTTDGTEIFYKDWGTGQPIVFSHGWPLSSDDWDTQMMFFLLHGYRVIAHDRQMYFFYATALVPFTAVLIALALGNLAEKGKPVAWTWVRKLAGQQLRSGQLAVVGYMSLVGAAFVYWSPIFYGFMVPEDYYQSLMWLPSWK